MALYFIFSFISAILITLDVYYNDDSRRDWIFKFICSFIPVLNVFVVFACISNIMRHSGLIEKINVWLDKPFFNKEKK